MSTQSQSSKRPTRLQGVAVVTVTPFDRNFRINERELRSHIRFLIQNDVDVIIPTATVGECYALTIEERKKIMSVVAEEIGGALPLVVCVNHTNMDVILDLSEYASKIGSRAVMIMPPYYRKLPEEEVWSFYRQLSEQLDIDIFLYNNPAVTQIDMSPQLLQDLAELKNVVALKECVHNAHKFEWTVRTVGQKIAVFNGHSERMEPYAYMMGAQGFVSTIANFIPRASVKIRQACLEGNYSKAQHIHELMMPFVDFVSGPKGKGLSVIKQGVNIVGFDVGEPKSPTTLLTTKEKQVLAKMIKDINAKIQQEI